MKILQQKIENNVLTATLHIELDEFASALESAYQANKDKYIVSDWREGMVPREVLERAFGPTVLYDEALDICIPAMYERFVRENAIVLIDQPLVVDVEWPEEGGVAVSVQTAVCPNVSASQYKGIIVKASSVDDEAFAETVMDEAVSRMSAKAPDAMIDHKLDAMVAEEKMRISQDAIYNVLADMVAILNKAYHATGVSRSMAQVRSEAMDIMLQTMSGDQKEPTREHFYHLLKETVRGYRDLPDGFDRKLDDIVQERKQKTGEMPPDERADEAFNAYLGSLDISLDNWRAQHHEQAAKLVKLDLLLDAVGKAEGLVIESNEMDAAYKRIAQQCQINIEEVKTSIDEKLLEWQLKRDKARQLIVDNAVLEDVAKNE